MNQKIKAPKIIIILALTLITIVFWAAFEIYRTFTTKPTPPVAQNILEPINPVLDADALSKIETRIHLDDSQIQNVAPVATIIASPSATPVNVPVSTTSAQPLP